MSLISTTNYELATRTIRISNRELLRAWPGRKGLSTGIPGANNWKRLVLVVVGSTASLKVGVTVRWY